MKSHKDREHPQIKTVKVLHLTLFWWYVNMLHELLRITGYIYTVDHHSFCIGADRSVVFNVGLRSGTLQSAV